MDREERMSRSQRVKGRRGQTEFAAVLQSRDWMVIPITCGVLAEDIVATSPQGKQYSVEVKWQKIIQIEAFTRQAREQANNRKLPWMLACRLQGHAGTWLVLRQDEAPVVWALKGEATQ
jgi:hypothetical protein